MSVLDDAKRELERRIRGNAKAAVMPWVLLAVALSLYALSKKGRR